MVVSSAVRTNSGLVSLVGGPNKLIVNEITNRIALFNVLKDPGETRNLAADHPELVAELRRILEEHRKPGRTGPLFEISPEPISKEKRELLESLGYTY